MAARSSPAEAQQGRAALRRAVRGTGARLHRRAALGRQGREDRPSNANHLSDTITVDGKEKNVVGLDGVPIGPQWLKADGKFFLGADRNGRDIMVRLLYGGRNSLLIGVTAALITTIAVDLPRAGLGLLPRPDGHGRQSPARRDVVVPRDHPGRRARRGVRAGRSQDRPDTPGRGLAVNTDLHHRLRLRAVHGETGARPGAVAAREGVRRGGTRAGRGARSGSCSPR